MARSLWSGQNWLSKKISGFNGKIAVIDNGKEYQYADLFRSVGEKVAWLRENRIKSGDVVAVLSDYSFGGIALLLALLENKNIIVPIANKMESEIRVRVKEAFVDKIIQVEKKEIKLVPYSEKHDRSQLIKELQNRGVAGLVLFSSGSLGKPKAMLHDLDGLIEAFKQKKERDARGLAFLMFDHIGGLNTLFNLLSAGATIVIPKNRDPESICEQIERYKVDLLPTTPTFLRLLLFSEAMVKRDLSSLKMITYGAEPMPERLLSLMQSNFPNVKFLQTFGTSETGIAKTRSQSQASTFLKIADENLEYKIVKGELWLKSRIQILGYLNQANDNFTQDGWYKTGDMVEEGTDGYIRIFGRTKELINVGGEKVLPSEVEAVLLEMPQISDCLVYGEKNAIMGQIVAAEIVLKEAIEAKAIIKAVKDFCGKRLAPYKIPVKVKIVPAIKFNDNFKRTRLFRPVIY